MKSDTETATVSLYINRDGGSAGGAAEVLHGRRRPHWSDPGDDKPPMRLEFDLTGPFTGPFTDLERDPAEEVRVFARCADGLQLCVRYRLHGGEPHFAGLELGPADGPAPVEVGARQLRRMGYGAVVRELHAWLDEPLVTAYLGEAWVRYRPVRPGRGGTDDQVYATWARRYVDALDADPRRPVRHLVEEEKVAGRHVTASQVRAYLNRARNRGFLTDAPPGLPGGELTDLGRQVLRTADDARRRAAATRRNAARAFVDDAVRAATKRKGR